WSIRSVISSAPTGAARVWTVAAIRGVHPVMIACRPSSCG
ncbi:MAG: hypothetical protein, partial [Olavius algarvensis Gamma 1 endosymbiont]